MNDFKPWFFSKGFVGPLVTIIVIGLQQLDMLHLDPDGATQVVFQLIAAAGAAVGMIGRAMADKRLAKR